MGKRINRISKDNPAAAGLEQVQGIAADVDTYAALAGFASSEAGDIIIKSIDQDVVTTIDKMLTGYKTMPELELRGLCAQLEARVQFLRTLKRAHTNQEDAEAVLAETLKSLTV
jgi:hypothetical protein